MSAIGTGYDLSASTYSPDGRIFQVDYATKAVDNSGTAIGLRCKDGVVLAVEKLVQSKLLVPGSNRRILAVDRHIGMAIAGLLADGRHIVKRARDEAESYRDVYNVPMPGKMLASRIGQYVSMYTLYSSVRPFGSAVLIGSVDENGPQLFMAEPSGGYVGCAIGKGKQVAKAEIEKLNLAELTVEQAVKEAARIIYVAHDENKDREFQLELSWVTVANQGRHQPVPPAVQAEAERYAQEALEEDDDMEDDEDL
ncbi:20S proteasome subunit [Thamnocephalis sphaerospora]|uniref:Proteasome subunit alpha type n=1 Tax=Thamnocephalis sphaerospora TaxID=78915 RepID=A0A4P9XMK8_9FUNG|nr:20S proteasome subunit [Thamnocephalis sphaerospora]|eukprot:RKP07153.1 20S proteasome subunit [Thamnocephalis sphaerospora]